MLLRMHQDASFASNRLLEHTKLAPHWPKRMNSNGRAGHDRANHLTRPVFPVDGPPWISSGLRAVRADKYSHSLASCSCRPGHCACSCCSAAPCAIDPDVARFSWRAVGDRILAKATSCLLAVAATRMAHACGELRKIQTLHGTLQHVFYSKKARAGLCRGNLHVALQVTLFSFFKSRIVFHFRGKLGTLLAFDLQYRQPLSQSD